MKYIELICGIAIIAATIPVDDIAMAESRPVEQVVKRVQDVYGRYCCFQARFNQLTVNVAMDLKDRFEGVMYIKKPALMALEVDKPEKQYVVIRGRNYSVYFPEDEKVIEGEIPPELDIDHFFGFLADIGNLDRNFIIQFPPKVTDADENMIFLELTDRKRVTSSYRIIIGLDMEQYMIRRTVIYDALGNYNRFDLFETRFLSDIPESRFSIVPRSPGVREPQSGSFRPNDEPSK